MICDDCESESPLADLFIRDPKKKTKICPACYNKKITKIGKKNWLIVLASLIILHSLVYYFPEYKIIYLVMLIAWWVIFTFISVALHELAHYVVTIMLGGICPIVTFGEGVPLFTLKTKNTLWQLCPSPTLGLAYCIFPSDKHNLWRELLVFLAGGLVNLLIAAFSFYFALTAFENNVLGLFFLLLGVVNALLGMFALFWRSNRNNLLSDGQQIVRLLRDKDSFLKTRSRTFQIAITQALSLRDKHKEMIDFILECENYQKSPVLTNMLGFAFSMEYKYDELLRWTELSLSLLEFGLDTEEVNDSNREILKAITSNNIAFALLFLKSSDTEKMKHLSNFAFSLMPWELSIVGTYASVLIRCEDIEKGVALMEKKIDQDSSISNKNLALSYLSLAEGYKKLNRINDLEKIKVLINQLDPSFPDEIKSRFLND